MAFKLPLSAGRALWYTARASTQSTLEMSTWAAQTSPWAVATVSIVNKASHVHFSGLQSAYPQLNLRYRRGKKCARMQLVAPLRMCAQGMMLPRPTSRTQVSTVSSPALDIWAYSQYEPALKVWQGYVGPLWLYSGDNTAALKLTSGGGAPALDVTQGYVMPLVINSAGDTSRPTLTLVAGSASAPALEVTQGIVRPLIISGLGISTNSALTVVVRRPGACREGGPGPCHGRSATLPLVPLPPRAQASARAHVWPCRPTAPCPTHL